MAEHDLLLTCDAGTTGVKCTVFSATGDALCSVRRSYPTAYPRPGWAEQDPDAILAAACDGIHELLMQVPPVRIACLGLSGTMNGCIPVAADGRALHPNIIHSDSRTGADVMRLVHELHEAGNTIVLITHDAKIAAQTPRAIHIHDGRVLEPADENEVVI